MNYDLNTLINLISALATIVSIGVSTVPIADVMEIYKTKQTEKFPYMVFISFILNSFCWAAYGFKINSPAVYASCLYSLPANLIYLIIYIISTKLSTKKKQLLISFSVFSIFAMYEACVLFNFSKDTYGSTGVIINMFAILTTVQKVKSAIDLQDYGYIPIRLVIFVLMNSSLWVTYAVLVGWDMYIFAPNFLGVTLSSFQIILYFYLLNLKHNIKKSQYTRLDKEGEKLEDKRSQKSNYLNDTYDEKTSMIID